MKLSVIIANYNYRDFVGAAISSALAVDWPDKEVIVVDDASTDNSRSVIDGFRGKVAAYFRPKSYQLGAHIFGFEQSTGDVIIFLDADDLLEPDVMLEVAKVWRPGVSKVQYRMNVIDATGTQLGTAIPQFPATDDPEKLRQTFLRTMTYTTPPGSGNAYSRDFVRAAFAMAPSDDPRIGRRIGDPRTNDGRCLDDPKAARPVPDPCHEHVAHAIAGTGQNFETGCTKMRSWRSCLRPHRSSFNCRSRTIP